MIRFPCPYLQAEVELSEEREGHIAERHPDLLPEHRERVAQTLAKYAGASDSATRSCSPGGTLTCGEFGFVHRVLLLYDRVMSVTKSNGRRWEGSKQLGYPSQRVYDVTAIGMGIYS